MASTVEISIKTADVRISRLLSSPLSVAVHALLLIGWTVSFVSLCFTSSALEKPNAAVIWSIWYVLLAWTVYIIVLFATTILATVTYYKTTLSLFAIYLLSITTQAVGAIIHGNAATQAVSAGYITMMLPLFVLVIHFSANENSSAHQVISKLSSPRSDILGSAKSRTVHATPTASTTKSSTQPSTSNKSSPPTNSTPNTPTTISTNPSSDLSENVLANPVVSTAASRRHSMAPSMIDSPTTIEVRNSVAIVFEYRARALFAYTANPEDPQEISFAKDQTLEVATPHGNKWWQCRLPDGTMGIAPSNYLELLP